MDEQKTLLQLISEKESELNERLKLIAGEADGIVSLARLRARDTIDGARAKGRKLATERYARGKAKIDREVEDIKGRGANEARVLRQSGDKNLDMAVEFIAGTVAYR